MRSPVTGPALRIPEAAAYIGWPVRSLATGWRKHPLLVAAAVKHGRRLSFLRPGLDRFLASGRVAVGGGA